MSVFIKGMEMPEIGENRTIKAEIRNINGKVEFGIMTGGYYCCEQWKYYPLVEVPPHGRLGDLDKLEQMFVDIDNAPYSGFDGEEPFYSAEDAAQIIRLAPTVIPASEVAPDINAAHKTMEEAPEIQHVGYDDAQLGREK